MFGLTPLMIGGIVRGLLTTAAGGLILKGTIDQSTAQSAIGAIATLATIGWSLWTKTPASLIAAVNSPSVPGVHVVPANVAPNSTVDAPIPVSPARL